MRGVRNSCLGAVHLNSTKTRGPALFLAVRVYVVYMVQVHLTADPMKKKSTPRIDLHRHVRRLSSLAVPLRTSFHTRCLFFGWDGSYQYRQ